MPPGESLPAWLAWHRHERRLAWPPRSADIQSVRTRTQLAIVALSASALPGRAAPASADEGPFYPISEFQLVYLHADHPGLPPLDEVAALEVALGRTAEGYAAPRPQEDTVTLRLADVAERPVEQYAATAIQHILEALVGSFSERRILGVYVAPDAAQIDGTGRDLRPDGETALRLVITTAVVADLRTVATGKRFPPEDAIDHPAHRRIRARSPIEPGDLVHRGLLDDYVFRLSRHPGRRVDAAIGPGPREGEVVLDYLVAENKPLVAYSQLSNTGTGETNRLRQRFGLIHGQLTNHDDVLGLDYITTGFEDVHALLGTYEGPVAQTDRLRWRVFGSFNDFSASEVGFPDDFFNGQSWTAGADLIWNFHQDRSFFVDAVVGLRLDSHDVENQVVAVRGKERFASSYVGVRLEEQTAWYSLTAGLFAEWMAGALTDPDPVELSGLGRLLPDTDWAMLRWNLDAAVFIEPLVNWKAWRDTTTPESSTLAHELALRFRGQWAGDNRLVPQVQQTIGGFRSVRGYPESVVAGDSVIIANLEYRFHLPRALPVQPTPAELFGEPFRIAPQNVYGRPDWDLVFRAFLDYGRSFVSDKLPLEREETLLGTGIGVELQLHRHLNVQFDWGFALRDSASRGVSSGSNRVHFLLSIFF